MRESIWENLSNSSLDIAFGFEPANNGLPSKVFEVQNIIRDIKKNFLVVKNNLLFKFFFII